MQGYESLSLAVSLLRSLMDYAALLPLGELTQKIIAKTGYDLAVLAAPDGQQRSRNVWKIAYLAREQEHLSCGEFAGRLSLMRQFGMQESEAPLDSTDAVKLMTVHASKGLEFPVVALPSLSFPICAIQTSWYITPAMVSPSIPRSSKKRKPPVGIKLPVILTDKWREKSVNGFYTSR